MPIVAQYARRVVAMGMGRVLADGPTAEVFQQTDILARTFIEPPQITQLAQRAQALGFDPGTLTVEEMLTQAQRLLAPKELKNSSAAPGWNAPPRPVPACWAR